MEAAELGLEGLCRSRRKAFQAGRPARQRHWGWEGEGTSREQSTHVLRTKATPLRRRIHRGSAARARRIVESSCSAKLDPESVQPPKVFRRIGLVRSCPSPLWRLGSERRLVEERGTGCDGGQVSSEEGLQRRGGKGEAGSGGSEL